MCRQPLAGKARADQKSALSCHPHRSCFLSAENVFRHAITIANLHRNEAAENGRRTYSRICSRRCPLHVDGRQPARRENRGSGRIIGAAAWSLNVPENGTSWRSPSCAQAVAARKIASRLAHRHGHSSAVRPSSDRLGRRQANGRPVGSDLHRSSSAETHAPALKSPPPSCRGDAVQLSVVQPLMRHQQPAILDVRALGGVAALVRRIADMEDALVALHRRA